MHTREWLVRLHDEVTCPITLSLEYICTASTSVQHPKNSIKMQFRKIGSPVF
jgi:hypothetical protein